MKVIDYLNAGNSINDLTDNFGIRVKEYASGLVVLNYDQIESPKNHQIADECRGLIVAKDQDGYYVVSKSFNRFYNLGECDNVPDSWDGYQFKEKADGSIIKMYYWDGRWEISTRGTAYGESPNPFGITFRSMVLDTLGYSEDKFQDWANIFLNVEITYVFELIGPMNRVVTPYKKAELVFLGMVCGETEVPYSHSAETAGFVVSHQNIRFPVEYQCFSREDVEALVSSLTDLQEGVVCHNHITGHRIKVKAAQYLAAHRIRGDSGTPTPATIAELVVINETAEFLTYFPEFQELFDQYINKYAELISSAERCYTSIVDIESQKDFANIAKLQPLSAILFTARLNKCSVMHAIASAKTSMLIKVLLEAMKQK